MTSNDTYKTVELASEVVLFKEKNSRFYGFVFPLESETEVKLLLEILKKQYPNAQHYCYAYQIGTENKTHKICDDGEPSGTAGLPIFGQIQSFEVTNILVVVVRFFGGIKLGVGGLVSAYKKCAQIALDNCTIKEKTIDIDFLICFDYSKMNMVMRIIKGKKLEVVSQEIISDISTNSLNVYVKIKTRKNNFRIVFDAFSSVYGITIEEI